MSGNNHNEDEKKKGSDIPYTGYPLPDDDPETPSSNQEDNEGEQEEKW